MSGRASDRRQKSRYCWGWGIEHEFLVTDRSSPSSRWDFKIVSSDHIINSASANTRDYGVHYDRHLMVISHPVSSNAQSSTSEGPHPPPSWTRKDRLTWTYPEIMMLPSLALMDPDKRNVIADARRNLISEWLTQLDVVRYRYQLGLLERCNPNDVADEETRDNETSPFLDDMERLCKDARAARICRTLLSKYISKCAPGIRVGDSITVLYKACYEPILCILVRNKTVPNDDPRPLATLTDVIRSLTEGLRRVIEIQLQRPAETPGPGTREAAKEPWSSKAVDLDGKFIEVRSTEFSNVTVADVAAQVKHLEKLVVAHARRTLKNDRLFILPHSGYVSEQTDDTPEYAGSYHVWVTLPHPDVSNLSLVRASEISVAHTLLAHRLQWIEPLLLSILSGDPRAPGNGTQYPRSSMRSTLNRLSGYGTTDVTELCLRPVKLDDSIAVKYFDDPTHARAPDSHNYVRVARGKDVRLWMWDADGNRLLPWSMCLDQSRTSSTRSGLDQWTTRFFQSRLQGCLVNIDVPYQRALIDAGARYKISSNNDIRSVLCEGLSKSLKGRYSKDWRLIRLDGLSSTVVDRTSVVSRDNIIDLVISFVGEEPVENPKNVEGRSSIQGIEFRMLDNFPSRYIDRAVTLVALVGASATRDARALFRGVVDSDAVDKLVDDLCASLKKHRALNDKWWTRTLVDVSLGGSRVAVTSAYIDSLRSQLGLAPSNDRPLTAYECLCDITHDVFRRNRNDRDFKLMTSSARRSTVLRVDDVLLPNFQEDAWRTHFKKLMRRDSDIASRFKSLRAVFSRHHATDGQIANIMGGKQWALDVPYLKSLLQSK